MRVNRDSLAVILATAAVLTVVSLGFWKTHGPNAQRLIRGDEKRIQNLSQLANEINAQYRQPGSLLPHELSDIQKARYADPVTRQPLEYSTKTPSQYTLCSVFSTSSTKEEKTGMYAFWGHPSGHKCFEFNAPEQVPQAPYLYY